MKNELPHQQDAASEQNPRIPRAFSDPVYARRLVESSAIVTGQLRVIDGMTNDDLRPTSKTLREQSLD